ncbi:MAG: outer membrane lipoprotein carrier protein LolA [Candidatus Adiutrix sp.]|jgi:hypothetical protein|nr:outer membrane lipoprotein carrier protein LolA [Candidatus Adiutrix sp.]
MSRFARGLVFVAWLFAAAPAASASGGAGAEAALASLRAAMSDVQSVSGRFLQEKRIEFLNEPVVSRGVFYFARPDYLWWEYTGPVCSGLEMEGGRVRAWTGPPQARLRQPEALNRAAAAAAGQIMLWMNLEPERIAAAYEVEAAEERPLALWARPRRAGAAGIIEAVQIEFSADRRAARRVTLFETGGTNVLTFEAVVFNQARPVRP